MRDSLKEHIENSREDFELYPFDTEKGWNELSSAIPSKQKKNNPWNFIGKAACFAFVLAGTIFFMNPQSQPNNEVAELESYYQGEIDQRITLVKSKLKDDRILKDLQVMDQAFSELKVDLKDNVDNQEVITAMMENYQLKLQILEQILSELEKEKSEEVL